MAKDKVLRVISNTLAEWLNEVNANADPAWLTAADLELPPTTETCLALLSKLAPGLPLPAEVEGRCRDKDDGPFRTGCFSLLARWHNEGLTLRIEPVESEVGAVEEREGVLLMHPGTGREDPFGLNEERGA